MKNLVRLSLLFGMIISCLSWQTIKVRADITPNPDGSVTITKDDIIKKMKVDGSTKTPVITNNGVKYQLTEDNKGNQVGAVYLEDRLTANDSFSFVGYMESYHLNASSNLWLIGDGQSIIFHGDDTKFYGESGLGLGILELKNARGLVYDVFPNTGMSSKYWQREIDRDDPVSVNNLYFQGWSTDSYGKGLRETESASYSKSSYINRGLKKVVMNYDSKNRLMTYIVSFNGLSNTHVLEVPDNQDYFYFTSTASTGGSTAMFNTYIESIKYTPYRKKTIKYIDADSKVEFKEYGETKEVKLNEKYIFEPKAVPGYDVVEIEGKLEGTVEFEENLADEFVNVYLRKQETKPTYDLVEISQKTFLRQTLNGQETLRVNLNEFDIPMINRPVSKITMTTPKELTRNIEQSAIIQGWYLSEYQTDTKNVYQIYNGNYNNILSEQGSLKSKTDIKQTIESFAKFKISDNSSLMDEKDIKIELSNYPNPYYENENETKKTAYAFPKINNIGFEPMLAYDFGVGEYNPLIPINTNFLSYRGVRGGKTSAADNTPFMNDTLGDRGVTTTDKNIILGKVFQKGPITSHLVKYDITSGLAGVDEMKSVPKIAIPQPVVLKMIDTLGNDLGTKKITTSYSMGDIVYSTKDKLPQIPDYHVLGFEDNQIKFPIKVTNKRQEIVVIYEPDQLYWGDVPWEFNEKTGELVFIDKGTLGEFNTSPWNRNDKYRVNSELIKKITMTSSVKAPKDSQQLFSTPNGGLTKVEYINGLEKLDTSQVNRMSNMFRHMYSLKELNVSSFDTSQVTNMGSMFRDLNNIETLNLSSFQTTNETDMNNLFSGTNQLKVLTLGDKTILNNTSLVTPRGNEYTGKWQSLGRGTIGKPIGDFVGVPIDLEKKTQKLPANATYVWEPVTDINLTINYFLLGNNGVETDTFIISDLEEAERKKAYKEIHQHQHTSLKELLKDNDIEPTPIFEGYEFITEKTSVNINDTQEKLTLDSQLPKEDLTINFYFKPTVKFTVPADINFGVRQKSDWLNVYSMEPSKFEMNNKISIIDTFETNKEQPNWSLYASTEGFYSEDSGVRLLADIMLKSPDFNSTKVISKESTPLYENTNFFKKDISLTDKKQEEGLFIRVAKVQELGKYNGVLKYKLETAP